MATPSPPPEAFTNGATTTTQDVEEFPEGVHHYEDPDEVPEDVWK